MFIRINEIKLPVNSDEKELLPICAKALSVSLSDILKTQIYRRSLDARRGRQIMHIYTVDVYLADGVRYKPGKNCTRIDKEYSYEIKKINTPTKRPVIVGFGPAGIFCGLVLAAAGARPIIIERGKSVDERVKDVENFFACGKLNTASNIQFGEGGAGTFSDGKLNTLVKDKNFRGRFVLEKLVEAGAPEEILYAAKPHVGTDKLRISIKNIRKMIEEYGGEVLFSHKLTGLDFDDGRLCAVICDDPDGKEKRIATDTCFLGLGHSARDTFELLKGSGFILERKPFSVGVRIEHKQSFINSVQYSGADYTHFPAADYKLVCHTKSGRAVYTFCMCPGGFVVAAASEERGVVTNGMSNFSRDGENANSALLVEILPSDFSGDDPLSGMQFQQELERRAFDVGGGEYIAPAQLTRDFLTGTASKKLSDVSPTYSRGVRLCDLCDVLPPFVTDAMREGIIHFDSILHGFADEGSVMTAVESRSSSPVRIVRDRDTMQALGKSGIYPIGEGAGYAGGIMSAAIDGMKAAEAYISAVCDD